MEPETNQGYVIYAIDEKARAAIEKAYTYQAPTGDQPAKYVDIRAKAKELAELISHACPSSRELSLAHTKLEECVMWANASIARNE